MGTNDKTVNTSEKTELLQETDRPPERRLTATFILGYRRCLRIDVTVMGPVSKKRKRRLALTDREADRILKTISDRIKLLEEELR